jgi:hypothetical protein
VQVNVLTCICWASKSRLLFPFRPPPKRFGQSPDGNGLTARSVMPGGACLALSQLPRPETSQHLFSLLFSDAVFFDCVTTCNLSSAQALANLSTVWRFSSRPTRTSTQRPFLQRKNVVQGPPPPGGSLSSATYRAEIRAFYGIESVASERMENFWNMSLDFLGVGTTHRRPCASLPAAAFRYWWLTGAQTPRRRIFPDAAVQHRAVACRHDDACLIALCWARRACAALAAARCAHLTAWSQPLGAHVADDGLQDSSGNEALFFACVDSIAGATPYGLGTASVCAFEDHSSPRDLETCSASR